MKQKKPWSKSQGGVIKDAREAHRMSQKQLAMLVGVSLRTIGNWELGKTHPQNSIGKLERVLGIRLRDSSPERDPLEVSIWQRTDISDDAKRQMIDALRRGREAG